MEPYSDRDLLKNLISECARDSFAELYRRYFTKCRSFVYAMTKDESVAEDITHDIFFKVWVKKETVSKVDSFSSYLFRMIRNSVIDHYESNAINRKYVARQLLAENEFCAYTEDRVNLDDLQLIIFNAVTAMPEQRRRIFTLSRYNGLSNSEIASLFGINVRTVENHITNALADIRTALSHA